MTINELCNREGLELKIKSRINNPFKWYSVNHDNRKIGWLTFYDFKDEYNSLIINGLYLNSEQQNKGYCTKLIKCLCNYAIIKGYGNLVLKNLINNKYNLTLNDRIKIVKKVGKKLKNEGLINNVKVIKYNKLVDVKYSLKLK